MSTTKNRRGEKKVNKLKLTKALDSAVSSQGSAELAVLHLFKHYDFDLDELRSILLERGLNVSFSKVKYRDIAPRVGLSPELGGRDMETFEIHRARIPTSLFKEIVQDIEIVMKQYGEPVQHKNEEARSRFLAPLFNRTVALFDLSIRNTPESIIRGRMTTSGRVEYHFLVFGGLSLLVIEVKYVLGSDEERLDAIAQVVAECDACDYANDRFQFPPALVYGVLCDGSTFEFFSFDGKTKKPTFSRGVFSDPPSQPIRALAVADFQTASQVTFIMSLRPICETIFYFLLLAYRSGVEAYAKRSVARAVKNKKVRKSTPGWKQAADFAEQALTLAVDAAAKAAEHEPTTDEVTTRALKCLQNRSRCQYSHLTLWG